MAKKRKKGVKVAQRPEDIEDLIVDIDLASKFTRVLVYAHNGVGKTRFAATAPKPLIIDIGQEGTKSAREFTGAKVFPAKTWSDIVLAYWYLKDGNHDFETLVIDGLTDMADACMRRVLRAEKDRDATSDPKTPSQRNYGTQYQLMRDQLYAFRNLPLHIVFLAKERTEGNADEGEEVRHMPELPNKARGAAMDSVDLVGRMYQREVKRKGKKGTRWETRMLVGPHENYESKNRINQGLGRIVRNPTMPMLIKADQRARDDKED